MSHGDFQRHDVHIEFNKILPTYSKVIRYTDTHDHDNTISLKYYQFAEFTIMEILVELPDS
jgi:hypothetical protein